MTFGGKAFVQILLPLVLLFIVASAHGENSPSSRFDPDLFASLNALLEELQDAKNSPPHTYPYWVSIEKRTEQTPFKTICGGTILNNRTILTAAQCFLRDPFERHYCYEFSEGAKPCYRIAAGLQPDTNATLESQVQYSEFRRDAVNSHPNFDIVDFRTLNDVAIVTLPTPLKFNEFVKPGKIVKSTNELEEKLWLISKIYDHVEKEEVFPVLYDDCDKKGFHNVHASYEQQFCGDTKHKVFGPIGFCSANLGAPLIALDKSDPEIQYLVGLALPRTSCAFTESGVYTNVTTFEPWIREQIAKNLDHLKIN